MSELKNIMATRQNYGINNNEMIVYMAIKLLTETQTRYEAGGIKYIQEKRTDIAKVAMLSEKTTRNAVSRLKEVGLIEIKKVGPMRNNTDKIYLVE